MATISSCAQDIVLPAPDLSQASLSVVQALAQRHSTREYADRDLTIQDISNLCWAACGEARDAEHITAASAMNRQEIRLFVFTKDNVYEYLAHENVLRYCVSGDHRALVAGPQEFVTTAPISLVLVADYEKFGMEGARAVAMACVDTGNISENINVYCESVGLATVPRATMDNDGIAKLLGFTDKQAAIINNPVGWPK